MKKVQRGKKIMTITKAIRARHLYYMNVNTDYYSFREIRDLCDMEIIEPYDKSYFIDRYNYRHVDFELFTWKVKKIDIKEVVNPESGRWNFIAVATLIDEIAYETSVKEIYINLI